MQFAAPRFRVAAGLIAALVLLAIGVLCWQLWSSQRAERAVALEQTEKRASQLASAVAGRMGVLVRIVDFVLLDMRREYGVSEAEFRALTEAVLSSFPEQAPLQLAITGADGELLYSSPEVSERVSIRDREDFKVHLNGGDRLFISKPVLGRLSKTWSIQFTRPILRGARFAGVVLMSLSPEYLGQMLAAFEMGPQDVAALFNTDGTFLARSRGLSDVGAARLSPARPFMTADAPQRGSYRAASYTDRRERLFAWERIPDTSLVVSVGFDMESAFAMLERQTRQRWAETIAFTVALLAFGILVLVLLSRLSSQQQAIAGSEERLRLALDASNAGTWSWDGESRQTFWDDRTRELYGFDLQEPASLKSWIERIHPQDREGLLARNRALRAPGGGDLWNAEFRALHPFKGERWVAGLGRVYRDESGRVARLAGINLDITARKRAEQQLRDDERRLNALIESALEAIVVTDAGQRIVLFNPAAEATFGYRAKEAIGLPIGRLIPERYRDPHREHMQRYADSGIASRKAGESGRIMGLRADGSEFPAEATIAQFSVGGEHFFTVMLRDVSEQLQNAARIHDLLRRLIEVQEAERRRVAADLHDLVGQNLSVVGIELARLCNAFPPEKARGVAAMADDLAQLVEATGGVVRQMIGDLRPVLLDDYGFCVAIESYARQFERRTGLRVGVEGKGIERRPAREVELALFRIAQEALMNAAKHAAASRVAVALSRADGVLRLCIEDDGRGMVLPATAAERNGGWGIAMMGERAEAVGGTLHIECPGVGTRIIVEIPHDDSHPAD